MTAQPTRRRSRRVLGLAGTGALALALTACGSHGTAASRAAGSTHAAAAAVKPVSAVEAVRLASAAVHQASSASVDGTLQGSVSAGGASTPVSMHLRGDVRWGSNPQMRMTMSGLKVAGVDPGTVSMIMTSRKMWMSLPILTKELGKKWLSFDLTELSKASGLDLGQLMSQSAQMDPSQYVDLLTASGDLREVGHQTVNGVATTHYAGDVDPVRAMSVLGTKLSPQVRDLIAKSHITSEHIDVWVDGQHEVRREDVSVKGSQATMKVSLTLSHYGVVVDVIPPPAADTVDFSQLMSQAGGLGG